MKILVGIIIVVIGYLVHSISQTPKYQEVQALTGVAEIQKVVLDVRPNESYTTAYSQVIIRHDFGRSPKVKAKYLNQNLPVISKDNNLKTKVEYFSNNNTVTFRHSAEYFAEYGSNMRVMPIKVTYEIY